MSGLETVGASLVSRAMSSAAAGDFVGALNAADRIISNPASTPDDVTTAAQLSSAIWSRRARLGRSVDLLGWLGPEALSGNVGPAATAAVAVGNTALAAALVRAPFAGPPSDTVIGFRDLAMALLESINGDARRARTAAIRSAAMSRSDEPGIVSANAIAILMSLHTGDIARAASIAERTVAADSVDSWFGDLHLLLAAWTSLLAGAEDHARGMLADLDLQTMTEREALWALALRCSLARRSGDIGDLTVVMRDAADLLDTVNADLFSIFPIGELWLGAIRTGDEDVISHLVDELDDLLRRLGDPPAWSSTYHWYAVQAAILADQPMRLVPHAHALRDASETKGDPHSAALAAAGRVWLAVLRGQFDADEVSKAAQTLATIGLSWDGARLASEAALRASDTADATALLQVARSLRPAADRTGTATAASALSERETEVANLLVLGHTYKDIGARLFISAKTVEHHVARIRIRLGAESRPEMMSMLRAIGHGSAGH
ncbi:helix-turn-helix transcriptional regulator [Smaragdicoccus niigatensis]|uniref:helix-turn-helix transcriptional regulator n=1 Tax=Smaragdicoccus niigatensis TaxID=359359 RepID=UPI000379A971|nr:helix-turn-helix transcriptional regulator [Smaragdicoccus niigatensis]